MSPTYLNLLQSPFQGFLPSFVSQMHSDPERWKMQYSKTKYKKTMWINCEVKFGKAGS